jgi:hypothetical protein
MEMVRRRFALRWTTLAWLANRSCRQPGLTLQVVGDAQPFTRAEAWDTIGPVHVDAQAQLPLRIACMVVTAVERRAPYSTRSTPRIVTQCPGNEHTKG